MLAAIELLASIPSPRGEERPLAEAVAAFGAARWPAASWQVQDVEGPNSPCAQVVARSGDPERGGLLLYSHLDTSLTGDASFDTAVTGRAPVDPGATVDLAAGTVRGFGLGVAKAPAAAALVAFGRAGERLAADGRRHSLRLLLAARGTHRAPAWATGPPAPAARTGIERWLADGMRPDAALVAKGGPAGVLHDEPGACYLRVRVSAGWGAVMNRAAVDPPGGLIAHLGDITVAVQAAGDAVASAALTEMGDPGQSGACFGLGAVRSGQPTKADLVPGLVEVFGYLVLPGAIDPEPLADDVARRVRAALAGTRLADAGVDADVSVIHAGASTRSDAAVVRAARAAWDACLDRTGAQVSGWTGSTDGVALRAAGIQTARFGPSRTISADGCDVVDLAELLALSRAYEQVAVELG